VNIYLLNIAIIIISYLLWTQLYREERGKKIFCVQATIQWILISGLRSMQVGADTDRYRMMFENTLNMKWSEIEVAILQVFRGNNLYKDPGYYLVMKVFQIFSKNYNLYLTVVAAIFMIPFGMWVYKNSEDILMSYIIFSCLFYSFFAITGTRQTIVTGIIVFIGTELLHKKKYWAFYLILLLLYPIHKSVIAFGIYPILYRRNISKMNLAIWTIVIGMAWIFRGRLMTITSMVMGYDQYDQLIEGAGASTFTLLFMTVLIFGVVVNNIVIEQCPDSVEAYNAMFIAAILLPMVSINQSAMRGVQYFSIYLVLFIPWIITSIKVEQRKIANIIGICLLILLLIRNNPQYTFFWQL